MDSGLINLNKPLGPTSFQMVARIRRLTGMKVGHAGTLDPLASGVLPLVIGQAVRLSEYLQTDDKVYIADVTFGVRTNTDDAEGEVMARQEVHLTREQVVLALQKFEGAQEQIPPQFAAIKQAGRHAYSMARRGQVVELAARQVRIDRITLLDWTLPVARIEVACGKGTYMRALARDLGEATGCGAYLTGLIRKQAGIFHLAESVSPEALESASDWRAFLKPMDLGLAHWPAFYLDAAETRLILNGLPIAHSAAWAEGTLLRGYDSTGAFFAVLRFDAAQGMVRPHKVFNQRATGESDDATA